MKTNPVWVRRPTEKQLAFMETCPLFERDPKLWPVERGDNEETFLMLEGRGYIEMEGGDTYRFSKGDLVTMRPKIKCMWCVEEHLAKRYAHDIDLDNF